MPWKETSAMDQRVELIADWLSGDYRKRRITLLPGESAIKILLSPRGRILFQVAKYIGNAMHWPETRQNMNMILNSADNLGHTLHASNDRILKHRSM